MLQEIKTIKNYDVTILKIELPKIDTWFTAYVKLKGKLKEDEYDFETYRDDDHNVIGIDTHHYYNMSQTLEARKKDAINQITKVIDEHNKLNNEK